MYHTASVWLRQLMTTDVVEHRFLMRTLILLLQDCSGQVMLIVIVTGMRRPLQPWEHLLPQLGGPVLECCAGGGLCSHHQLQGASGVARPGSGLQRVGGTGRALRKDAVQPTCFCGAAHQVRQAFFSSSSRAGSVVATPPQIAQNSLALACWNNGSELD
jgi:hypothetical protein